MQAVVSRDWQGLNDAGRAVMAASEALVVEEPGVDILHHGADGCEPGAMFNALVPDHGPDALAQAKPAVIGAVVASISQNARDGGADDQSKAQQLGKHLSVVDVGGRGHRAQRPSLGRDDNVPSVETTTCPRSRRQRETWCRAWGPSAPSVPRSVGFGPVSSPPCLARTLQLSTTTSRAWQLGSLGGGFGAGPDHAEQYGMDPGQQGDLAPVAQPPAQRRTRGAADTGEQLAPLDAFAQKEL